MKATRRAAALALFIGILAWVWHDFSHRQDPRQSGAGDDDAAVVSATTVAEAPWQRRLQAFGQIRAVRGIDVAAEISGIVADIQFQSGAEVATGTVLLRLRPNDDAAKLAALQASADLWEANLQRDRKQFDLQAVSRATVDTDNANLRSFRAQVLAQRALMEEKNVRAPFAGRLGIRLVDPGQYLVAGTAITSLQALDPIYADFNIPQQQAAIVRAGQEVHLHVDAYPERTFAAVVLAVDSHVDPTSRMISVRAQLPNADHTLLPGMFTVVEYSAGSQRMALSVPLASIHYTPYGDFGYILTSESGADPWTAKLRALRVGDREGERVLVLDGLRPGDRIVTAGQIKLHDGSLVRIDNTVQPGDQLHPHPQEE